MKRITAFILTFVLMFTFSLTTVHAEEKPYGVLYGKIVNVHDGDSFSLLTIDNKLYKFKISGIDISDSPDSYQFLKSYLKGKNARVTVQNIPSSNLKGYSYGTVNLYGTNETDIAKTMLGLGYVSVNTATCASSNLRTYTSYENSAKYAQIGIWKQK